MANTRGIKAGRAYVELGVGDKLTAGLKRAQARLRAFGTGVTGWGKDPRWPERPLAAPVAISRQDLRLDGRRGGQDVPPHRRRR